MPNLNDAFGQCAMIAIIRGAQSSQITEIGQALLKAGVKIVEVPLNSPTPFDSIARLKEAVGDEMVVGAGTVLNEQQVHQVAAAGGQLCVSPNTDSAVIRASLAAGLEAIPGYQTPTEAFTAINAGATWLKCFPVSCVGAAGVNAHRDVIAPNVKIVAVGGVTVANVNEYLQAGCNGVALAGSLYRPGDSIDSVHQRAKAMVAALQHSSGAPA